MLQVHIAGVEMDDDGLMPGAIDAACTSGSLRPRALYCMPTAHNPTAITWSEQRRREVVMIARRHGLQIIEDDVFGLLASA